MRPIPELSGANIFSSVLRPKLSGVTVKFKVLATVGNGDEIIAIAPARIPKHLKEVGKEPGSSEVNNIATVDATTILVASTEAFRDRFSPAIAVNQRVCNKFV